MSRLLIVGFLLLMTETLINNTLVSVGLFVTSLNPQLPVADPTTFYPGTTKEYFHVVKEGESFASIAELYYEDETLWTAIWEDNEFEGGPNALEPGMRLLVRRNKPESSEQPSVGFVQSEVVVAESSPTLAPVPTTQPAATTAGVGPLNDAQINFLGTCESGMRPATNTGNGFYGAFQFTIGTWNAMQTGFERADLAPLEVQIAAVQKLLSRSSIWTQFPGCAAKMQSVGLI
jgi:hypothetical protein